ncbi:hypothetical protein OAG75_01120 [bacterium]|nr:hypothetical protein [bacterium]
MNFNKTKNVGQVRFNGHVWRIASDFSDAADALFDSDSQKFVYPILMNYAFACELALKACSVQTRYNCEPPGIGLIPSASFKPTSYGHDLEKLFDQLSPDTRGSVSNEYKYITSEELCSQLALFKDYFVDVRYSFEQKSQTYDLSGLRRLANGLVAAVLEAGRKSEGF